MERNLWEVRNHVPDGIARVLFTLSDHTIVLVHGYIKKTAQTPKAELELARRRMKEVHHA